MPQSRTAALVRIDRRILLAQLAALSVAPGLARADTITDDAGRTVTIPKRVTKVFAAGGPAAVLLYTLAPELLIGWPRRLAAGACDFLTAEACKLPLTGPIAGTGGKLNTEELLNHGPDLILDVGSLSASFASLAERVEQQTRIPYALLDGRLAAAPAAYRLLGQLVRREQEAERLAAYATRTIETIRERVARIPTARRPRIYHARTANGLNTPLPGSINLDPFDIVGAKNVASDLRGGANVTIEQVLSWDPEMIITIDREFAGTVAKDAVWKEIAAVKSGRVYLAPDLPFGWVNFVPSVNRLVGLWWLAKTLYPQDFPEDIAPMVREFYALFYHVSVDDAQVAKLLNS
jgi:iron complex transport system substrate-binding protein